MELSSTTQEDFSIHSFRGFGLCRDMASWADRANQELKRRGWLKAELLRRTGLGRESLYKQLQGDVAQPRGDTLERIASALGINSYWLATGLGPRLMTVPVVGFVSAGEEFHPIDDHEIGGGLDEVSLDLDIMDPIAVRVRGNSMAPVYRNGDYLFCSRVRGADITSAVGSDCAILLRNGAGFVKQLRRAKDGGFILRSYNAAFDDIEGVEIDWVAPILMIRRAG